MNKETVDNRLPESTAAHGDDQTVGAARNDSSAPAALQTRASTILLTEAPGGGQEFVRQVLNQEPYRLLSVQDGSEIFAALNSGAVDLVILSNEGGLADGLDWCRKIKGSRKTELVPVLMLTSGEIRSQIQALSAGADDFLCPAANPELARTQIRALLRHKAATDRLEQTETILFALAQAVEQRDVSTGNHCERLALRSLAVGLEIGLSDEDLQALYRGGYLHDIGKVGIPDHVLLKPGPLNEEEWEAMRTHPQRGEEICRPLRSLERVLPIIRHHHERWDGSGYPDGLKGDRIPLLARVLQLSDIYDALVNQRPYKKAMSSEAALELMSREREKGWRDPELMDVFVHVHKTPTNTGTWKDAEEMRQSLRNLQQHLMEA